MTRFKICGLRDADNALVAADAGADFLGFVFVPGVRRQLTEDLARAIIEEYRRRQQRDKNGPRLVGLFADQSLDDVNRIVERCGLDLAQLCGDEPPEYWGQVSVPVIKQIKVRNDGDTARATEETLRRVDEVIAEGHTAMLDRYEAGALGGTGLSFDWTIASEVARHHDFLLAGGLTPENVGVAINTAAPWGVDVSSGVETDLVKDPKKIAAFAREVKRASAGEANAPTVGSDFL